MKRTMTAFCLSLLLVSLASASESLSVRVVGRWDSLPDYFSFGVAVQGSYAYVADYYDGLRVISISDPVHPREVGYYDTPGHAHSVVVVGDRAYVSDGDSGLRVISTADPAHPYEIGHCATPGYAQHLVLVGDLAYVADDSGLSIISVADPVHPNEVGRYDDRYGALGVAVAGAYAYVCNTEGLWVVSVSDPTKPTWVGRYITSCIDVAVQGSYAYVASAAAGLRVVSIADPANPVEVGSLVDTINFAVRLAVSGHYVYVVGGIENSNDGVRVISVADPANPVVVGYSYFGRSCVALSGGYVYTCHSTLFGILEFYGGGVEETPVAEARTPSVGPTVVRGVLNLAVDSGQNTAYRAELLDVAGRKASELRPGANDVGRLAPGVYFVRTEPTVVTKVIVAR